MSKNLPFKPRAQILLQLGDQLIRNEGIAVLELLKNAYDADATKVKIIMNNIDDPDEGLIIIEDNGFGMDIDTVTNVWMEPGNTHKRNKVEKQETTKLGRLPIGEKGIGRFGVHKLGRKIELISRSSNQREVYINIDWTRFEDAEYLEEVGIDISERKPEIFLGESTGTKIIISKLSSAWTRGMLRNTYRIITSLNSPFSVNNSFRVNVNTSHNDWLKGLMTFSQIKDYALFYSEITLRDNVISDFYYEFRPYDNMNGLKAREIRDQNIRMVHRDNSKIDLSKYRIGEVKIKLYAYDRTSSLVTKYINDKRSFSTYLNENGGVRVYRDNIRIYNYGEKGNDWLELEIERVKKLSEYIGNNIIIGGVFINRSESVDLKEKANREGFIENEAFYEFKSAIQFGIDKINTQRNIDKSNLKTWLGGGKKEPVVHEVSRIRKKIRALIPNEKDRNEIDGYLKRIEDDYKLIKETYIKTSSAGASYGIVIHEIDKIIKELNIAVMSDNASFKVKNLAKHLSRLVDSYAELLRNKHRAEIKTTKIIKQALFNIEYRLKAHNVTLVDLYSKNDQEIVCSSNLVIGSIINIIDNSIWWTEYSQIENKKILIKVTKEIDGYISIIIADNGTGFSLSPEDMIKPFVTSKPGGIGIGLNVVNEIMISQKGKLEFPEYGDIDLPKDFENGAVIALCFKEYNQ